ncbi:MAG TPA: hypothetical protein H9832_03775 [Candidatus Agathobaculum merdavium]|nr:hypothetical protein [Candidatus Agathobaculum merdavium]
MYLAISLTLVAMVILVFWLTWKLRLCEDNSRYWQMQAKDAEHYGEEWKNTACQYMSKEKDAREQAHAFEQAAKTMEEHLAAERGRADRLAEALRMSEDARCELKQQLEKMRKQVNTTGSTILDEMKRRGEKPVFTAVMQRDLANIMAYNGTAQLQEVLTDE